RGYMQMGLLREYFEFAQLSQAAYSIFLGNDLVGVRQALVDPDTGAFSVVQALDFTDPIDGYSLLDDGHHPNDASGFSATVFRSNATNRLVLAIRGTESGPDLAEDLFLLSAGYAPDQLYALHNSVTRLTAAKDE